VETVALSATQLPAHTHAATTTATAQSRTVSEAASPVGRVWAPSSVGDNDYADASLTPEAMAPEALVGATTVGSAGSSSSHTNIMPTLAINHVIALVGFYPSRN